MAHPHCAAASAGRNDAQTPKQKWCFVVAATTSNFIASKPHTARKPKPETTRYPTKRQAKKEARPKGVPLHPLDAMGPIVMREVSPAATGEARASGVREYRTTQRGKIFLGDNLELLRGRISDSSVDLIMTSPPFGLVRKKDYGNVDAHDYVEWFKQFGREFHRMLKDTGSLVIDIRGAWISGQPLAA